MCRFEFAPHVIPGDVFDSAVVYDAPVSESTRANFLNASRLADPRFHSQGSQRPMFRSRLAIGGPREMPPLPLESRPFPAPKSLRLVEIVKAALSLPVRNECAFWTRNPHGRCVQILRCRYPDPPRPRAKSPAATQKPTPTLND